MPDALIICLIIAGLFVLYVLVELYEHKCIQVTRRFLNTNIGIKALVISDLHNFRLSDKTLQKMAKEQPDCIFLPGDMINKATKNPANAIHAITAFCKIAPVFYSLGNHELKFRRDYPDKWNAFIKSLPANCTILDNAFVKLNENTLIYGISLNTNFYHKGIRYDYSNETPSIAEPIPEGKKVILLAHHPGFFPYYETFLKTDVILSGHLHGGLVRLPFINGLVYFTKGDKQYDCGIYRDKLVVTRGIGNHNIPARFLNRCEFIVLTL